MNPTNHPNFVGYLVPPEPAPSGIPVYSDPETGCLTLTQPEVTE